MGERPRGAKVVVLSQWLVPVDLTGSLGFLLGLGMVELTKPGSCTHIPGLQ